jgi:hypothetical protein
LPRNHVSLEYFVHGALCVAYSGQCYISQAHTGRSANRGECSQACRLPYTLVDDKGKTITENQHLLSMKDNNQTENLLALVAGRRQLVQDRGPAEGPVLRQEHHRPLPPTARRIIAAHPEFSRASSGRAPTPSTPQPDKTFNRGYTDYFAGGRQDDIGAFDSPAFVGELIGEVAEIGDGWIVVNTEQAFHNGDGVCFYDAMAT